MASVIRRCACGCGLSLVGRADKRYAAEACRKRVQRQASDLTQPALPLAGSAVGDALRRELVEIGVISTYEAVTALELAAQLDSGRYLGAAFVSLSKELDRRVDALRLKGQRPDDPTVLIRRQVEAKQLRLVNEGPSS